MANPIWITESNLGTFGSTAQVFTNVVAKPVPPAISVSYQLVSGALPNGLFFYSDGYIKGTIDEFYGYRFTFTLKATDNLNNSTIQTFTMDVASIPAQPTWITPAGTLGGYPCLLPLSIQLSAKANLPAVYLKYELISGSLPDGCIFLEDGTITGTPSLIAKETTSKFTVRAIDNNQNVRDRTFTMLISGSASPKLTIPNNNNLFKTLDSIWTEYQVPYTNPDINNIVKFKVTKGVLPPGLEINEYGLIRGYAKPPVEEVNLLQVTTAATDTSATNNVITCLTTLNFVINRPIIFSGPTFGGIENNVTYYVATIISPTQFTISLQPGGTILPLNTGSGFMNITLPATTVGEPIVKTYNFDLTIESFLGSNSASYSIIVSNQNASTLIGGPGFVPHTRKPVILNTRPLTYTLNESDLYYGYYILPKDAEGYTYPLSVNAPIGITLNDNYFAFKVIGNDFDGDILQYNFSNMPFWLTANKDTGWVTGTPEISVSTINEFTFTVSVAKKNNVNLLSENYRFSVILEKDITNNVNWLTDSDLGTLFNGQASLLKVEATADSPLYYRIYDGALPPNLTLLSNGEIIGNVAFQPGTKILDPNTVSSYTFTVEVFAPLYPVIKSQKTFTVNVLQKYRTPMDNLYIEAYPSISDRLYIDSLLKNDNLIPTDYLYRPTDPNFGKATHVIYDHAYGIYANSLPRYLEAITKNHYWRNITLGELATAVARDSNGKIIYEVVYSKVIDNLINPYGVSVPEQISWPRTINLNLGPWYTSVTNSFTSFQYVLNQEYYTSLTPGSVNELYPNSLPNMRNRVAQNLGQELNTDIFPLWMTSQQLNGSTLGYTPAWVICYTKPYIVVDNAPVTYEQFTLSGLDRNKYQSYAEIIKSNIEKNWKDALGNVNKLNKINFQIDRFNVNKSTTYNYDNTTSPPTWISLPSANPVPDPINSKDFYVIFPRKTILPDNTQY